MKIEYLDTFMCIKKSDIFLVTNSTALIFGLETYKIDLQNLRKNYSILNGAIFINVFCTNRLRLLSLFTLFRPATFFIALYFILCGFASNCFLLFADRGETTT